MKRLVRVCGLALLFIVVGLGWGCASSSVDSDNMAERPWNAPKNWEHGLPPSMLEGR
jgi:hypothetical protein